MAGLADLLLPVTGPPTTKKGKAAAAQNGVVRSQEWKRVHALPRRHLDLDRVPDLTPIWAVDGCDGCALCRAPDGSRRPVRLRPIQSAALLEAERAQGLVAPIGVGHGKSLLSLLLPDALRSERALILVKPRLKKKFLEEDVPLYSRHFRLPMDRITVMGYSALERVSRAHGDTPPWWKWTAYLASAICSPLDEVDPDLIIPDEAHMLVGDSARARVFWAHARKNRRARVCPMSGTFGDKSVKQVARLAWVGLGPGSPYPSPGAFSDLDDWSRATDPEGGDPESYPMEPGALLDLCGPKDLADEMDRLSPPEQELFVSNAVDSLAVRRRVARRILRRRISETAGVVATSEMSVGCGLVLRARPLGVPDAVAREIERLRRLWMTPDGRELDEAMHVAEVARQLALGFYYRPVWPGGVPDKEWIEARNAWYKFVRHALRYVRRPGMTTPYGVQLAVERGDLESPAWSAWAAVRHRPEPPTEAVWISDFAVEDCVNFLGKCERDRAPGIVWVDHDAFFDALVARGADAFGEGSKGDAIERYRGPACVAKRRCHGDGKNLQHFRRNLWTKPMASGKDWEQGLGRTHRSGQLADEVENEVYVHDRSLRSALQRALREEEYAWDMRSVRRLLVAERDGLEFLDDDGDEVNPG